MLAPALFSARKVPPTDNIEARYIQQLRQLSNEDLDRIEAFIDALLTVQHHQRTKQVIVIESPTTRPDC